MSSTRRKLHAKAARAAAVLLLFAAPSAADGQGWIEPNDVRDRWVERLGTDVRVRVTDQVAQVEVTEWFENDSRGVAEGTYFYPLPGEAAFGSFSLWHGDQELRGEVQARLRDVSNGARLDEVVREMAAPELAQEGLRQVGGRLFQRKDGVWTEAPRCFVEEGTETIGSEELLGLARDFRGAPATTPETREERR